MARDWVKLYTRITRDPDINGLDAEVGWNWTRMLALAGDNEERGRIGCVRQVAYVLRVSEDSIAATVQELDGRIEDRDGVLHFRDWADWQAASNKERQAAHREARRNDASPDVTGDNDNTHKRPEEKRREEKREKEPAPTDVGAWGKYDAAVSQSLGGTRVVNAKTGEPLAWMGELRGIAGRYADDAPAGCALWVKYTRSDEWGFRPRKPRDLPAAFGAWCEKRKQGERPACNPITG